MAEQKDYAKLSDKKVAVNIITASRGEGKKTELAEEIEKLGEMMEVIDRDIADLKGKRREISKLRKSKCDEYLAIITEQEKAMQRLKESIYNDRENKL